VVNIHLKVRKMNEGAMFESPEFACVLYIQKLCEYYGKIDVLYVAKIPHEKMRDIYIAMCFYSAGD